MKGRKKQIEQDLQNSLQSYIDSFSLSDRKKQQMKQQILEQLNEKKTAKAPFPFQKIFRVATACILLLLISGIGIHTAKDEKVADFIRNSGGRQLLTSIQKLCGIEPESAEIIQNMTPEAEVYAPPIIDCSDQRIIFATSRGMIIYNRSEEKITATIDLQKIGCNYFSTNSITTKIISDHNMLTIFNIKGQEVQGTCYIFDLSQLQTQNDAITNLSPSQSIAADQALLAQWEKNMGNRYVDTFDSIDADTMDQWENATNPAFTYSEQAVSWTSSEQKHYLSCLLLCGKEYQLYTWEPDTGLSSTELLQTSIPEEVSQRTEKNNILPPFQYTGEDGILKAICAYTLQDSKNKYYQSEHSVAIPAPIIYDIIEEDGETKVFGNFYIYIYYRNGNTLENESGGEMPACLHLTKKDESWQVTKAEKTGDGRYYRKGIEEFCEGHPEILSKYFDFEKTDEQHDKIRRELIMQYVTDNELDIEYYHDYGWDPEPVTLFD